ncbi:hypothetical protein A2Z23_03285 [Candidatus Curtissbacteria bacterium RBG_16_39_7]|uniref:Glycosyltransferase 2-like domain-containing protein n=1 Tax=Candidatus Curtissbacteria bacterium RBG_16_39_7 TaxID=1797707 RepID=A0A1F5G4Q0_9BACT|nr:MAG: hypothetical protein A2Z23_03285 [Candidatus Curtissbacteria bacterium RBG_16_39_7]
MIELSVILPVHNEENIIEVSFKEIYKAVKNTVKSSEFILVENGSQDKTLEIVKKICQKYDGTRFAVAPKGYGSAVLKGLELAGGKYVCYMPSDGQIDLEVFPKLWKEAKTGRYQLVKVKRITRESLWRTIVSISFSLIIPLLFRTPRIDINGSPRIFEKKYLSILDLKSKDSFIDAEFLIKITKLDWSIKEVPMKNLPRLGGKSTRSLSTFLEFFSNIYKFKFER